MKPATDKAWATRRKLQQLAERGIDAEKDTAAEKLARLERRYDFSVPDEGASIFAGTFERSATAVPLATFAPNESEVGTLVKWAIENATGLATLWRNGELWVEAAPASLKQLSAITERIRAGFSQLWETFRTVPDTQAADRRPFFLGLYDGMMSDQWQTGKPLPNSTRPPAKRTRATKRTLAKAPAIALHPYSVALDMGRQIRLSVPLESVVAELRGRIELLTAEAAA